MLPNALELIDSWRAKRRAHGHALIALDFDGTIAPIVRRPQEAYMLESARPAIERLLERPDTDVAIVIALVSFVGTVAYARYIERDEAR